MAHIIKIYPRDDDDTGAVGVGSGSWRENASDEDLILEAWSQGFMVGSLIIMACITIANMRRGVLLHKLILVEVSRRVRAHSFTRARLTRPSLATCSLVTW